MDTLIQHACGIDAEGLLSLIAPVNAARCLKHGWRYLQARGVFRQADSRGVWARFALMSEVISADPGGRTIWLDGSDAIWWRDENIGEAFDECGGGWDVGMVPKSPNARDFNSGAIYCRNTPAALAFCERCLAHKKEYEAAPTSAELAEMDRIVAGNAEIMGLQAAALPTWWNDWPGCGMAYPDGMVERPAIVRALHGCGLESKRRGMKRLAETAEVSRA